MRFLDPNRPFAPARVPFFYGWLIAVVGSLGILMSIPGQTAGVSVFTDPLLEATGLERVTLSLAYLIGTATSGLLLPSAGRWVDRIGVRLSAVAAALGLALTLVYLSQVDRIGQSLGDSANAHFALLAVGFVALRFSGQGMLTLVSRTMIGRWFDHYRGIVSGVSGIFVSFGFSGAPIVLALIVDQAGWRGAWLSMALVVGLGMSTLAYLFYRDTPESVGLVMDGRHRPAERAANAPPRENLSREQALRTMAFWAVALTLSTQALTITGFTFHIVDLGAEAGLSRAEAVEFFLPMSVLATTLGVLVGWLGDRMRIRPLLIAMALLEGAGIIAATQFDSQLGRWLTMVCFGAASGFHGPLATLALPRYFGRLHLGAINGAMMGILVIASALGPSIFALGHDITGHYAGGLLACLAPAAVALLFSLFNQTPERG
ncbi:MFS transporter [Haliangium ochraceum]|uniref:MFS transporter n=1 Tax=Haliangium ochraceum TaxID=80816 RepID=UPI00019BA56A|nr:MFS transporter [Haliangium ochraceum]